MNESLLKLNTYDHFGYVLVGIYQIFLFFLLSCLLKITKLKDILNLINIEGSIMILLISYFLGHIIQSISNLYENNLVSKFTKNEDDKKSENNNKFDHIYKKARKFFNLSEKIKQKVVFQYCYLFSLSKDLGGQITLFNSSYSFYRGLFISSLINLVILIGIGIFSFLNSQLQFLIRDYFFYLFLIADLIVVFLFYNRKERFFKYFREKVLINFDIISR